MAREIALQGVYMPTLSLVFVLAMLLAWLLDRVMSGLDLYRWFWHPALLRLSVFAGLFSALALPLYR